MISQNEQFKLTNPYPIGVIALVVLVTAVAGTAISSVSSSETPHGSSSSRYEQVFAKVNRSPS